jgi:circadian clock protein KaiC
LEDLGNGKVEEGVMSLSALLPGLVQPITTLGYALLLSGAGGSGKTTYGLQFANEGLQAGEKAIIVTFDMPENEVLETAERLGYDFASHTTDLKVLDYFSTRPANLNDISIALHKALGEYSEESNTRIVVDSLSTLALLRGNDALPPWVFHQRARLRKSSTVSLFCYDPGVHPPMLKLALQNVLDGTLELRFDEKGDGDLERYFRIFHLRGVGHSAQWHRFTIAANQGIQFFDSSLRTTT